MGAGAARRAVVTVVATGFGLVALVGCGPTTTAGPGSSTTAGLEVVTTPSTAASTTLPTTAPASSTPRPATSASTSASTTAPPVVLDPAVAALPPGRGARIAIVVDDVGGPDTYLADYLALPQPLTFAVIPSAPHASADDERIHAAGREVLMHLPLANRPGHGDGVTRLSGTETPEQVEAFVQASLARVPHAEGANNHEGSYGSTRVELMRALLASLHGHGLWFLDSVTSQRTVGFALEGPAGMPPRVNNVFLDHLENDADSLQALLHLAQVAAANGGAIGICHVHHPYLARVLAVYGPQLEAQGYRFLPLSQVTGGLAGGLDTGVRASI